MGIAPSLLYPTSTRTSPVPTWTTRPCTTSPSSNSLLPAGASWNQSSMRSSAASSFRGPPRFLRVSSIAMLPVPPVDVFERLPTPSASDSAPLVGRPSLPCLQLCDGGHHRATHVLVI